MHGRHNVHFEVQIYCRTKIGRRLCTLLREKSFKLVKCCEKNLNSLRKKTPNIQNSDAYLHNSKHLLS